MDDYGKLAQEIVDLVVADMLPDASPLSKRIVANRVIDGMKKWAEIADPTPPPNTAAFTNSEAARFARHKLEFGKYTGTPVGDVPLDYLAWLADSCRTTWLNLHRYLNSDRVKRELQPLDGD